MRRRSALAHHILMLVGLLIAVCAGTARAQIAFDNQDWTLDRGALTLDANLNGFAQRQGYNNFNNFTNLNFGVNNFANGFGKFDNNPASPNPAIRHWDWPIGNDLALVGANITFYTDNPWQAGPNPPALPPLAPPPIGGGITKAQLSALNGFQQSDDALAWFLNGVNNNWVLVDALTATPGQPFSSNNDGGFSYDTDPSLKYAFDYFVCTPVHGDFTYLDSGVTKTATLDQLTPLPYVPPVIYKSVNDALVNARKNNLVPIATWSLGSTYTPANGAATAIQPAYYSIDIHTPGLDPVDAAGVIHPDLQHVLVRVSYTGTVNAGAPVYGTAGPGQGGIEDPVNSRIFMIDLSGTQPDWRSVAAGASAAGGTTQSPALFLYDGNPADQITVTLYALTPDNPTDTNVFGNPPLLTADAVRFNPVAPYYNPSDPNYNKILHDSPLATISAGGSITASAVVTNKTTSTDPTTALPTTPNLAPITQDNLYYVARQEQLPLAEVQAFLPTAKAPTPIDPTDPTQPGLSPGNDSGAVVSVPVFYCLTNQDGITPDTLNGVATKYWVSKHRVRWRYIAVADANTASCVASPLLTNVRCRDGKVRPMVYFVTSSGDNTVGHIYALDPKGDNPIGVDPNDDLASRTTKAYWTYPSIRPLLGYNAANVGVAANEPGDNSKNLAPAEWYDPNYTLPAKLPGALSRIVTGNVGYKENVIDWTFGGTSVGVPDQTENAAGVKLYDGDIVGTNVVLQPYVTRTGQTGTGGQTKLIMPGIVFAPTLVDDPNNPTGPQVLVVTGESPNGPNQSIGGRIWAFDAGGRGDYGKVTTETGVNFQAGGTTQRLWTWPHYGLDAYHRVTTPDASAGYTQTMLVQDDLPVGYISGSLMFDPNYPPGSGIRPLVFGATDGHMYAVLPVHDRLQGISSGQVAFYDNRMNWVFPAQNQDGVGSLLSTPAFIHTTDQNGAKDLIVFNADTSDGNGGRIYAIPEHPGPDGVVPSPHVNTLQWVYPPLVDNMGNFVGPLPMPFLGSAPLPVNAAFLNNLTHGVPPINLTLPISLTLPYDMVYAVQSDGTVVGVQANPPNGQSPLLYSQSQSIGSTITSPIAMMLKPIQKENTFPSNISPPGVSPYVTDFPSLVFTVDDPGGGIVARGIYGVSLAAIIDTSTAGGTPPFNNGGPGTTLPIVWAPYTRDSTTPRTATVSLANGYFVEGDEGGQLWAYSTDTTSAGDGTGDLSGDTTLPSANAGDLVGADVRVVDYYAKTDYDNMKPGVAAPISPYGPNAATPLQNNVPTAGATGPDAGVGADWGTYLYVAAAGVYHAQPQMLPADAQALFAANELVFAYGTDAPRITVTFTMTQPGGSQPVTVTVPGTMTEQYYSTTGTSKWPTDEGYAKQDPNFTGLSYYGTSPDPNNQPTPVDGSNAGLLTLGKTQLVFPWVARYKFLILPDASHPFPPGLSGVRVSAQVSISQNVQQIDGTGKNQGQVQLMRYDSIRLFSGQRDAGRLTDSLFGNTSINDLGARGRGRNTYITNPIGLTVRGYTPGASITDQTAQPNIIGWAGPVDGGATDISELLGNGAFYGVTDQSKHKRLYAPVAMTENGSTATYSASGANGQNALAVVDRSNYSAFNGPLQVKITPAPLTWKGDYTSVMNPLPWEQLPNDQQSTIDYPAIPVSNLKIVSATEGADATLQAAKLQPPLNASVDNPQNRQPVPTPFTLTLNIPKYQPANVNRGPVSINVNGVNHTYGSALFDPASQQVFGTAADVTGPLSTANGGTIGINANAYPAGGYVSQEIQVAINLTGNSFRQNRVFRGSSAGRRTQTWREFMLGMCVPPTVNMQTGEQTLDFGSLPMGAGYSDLLTGGNGPGFNVPFAPTGSSLYPFNPAAANNGLVNYNPTASPWDDPSQLGQFFRSFSVTSDSNINIVNLRVTKLFGAPDSAVSAQSLGENPSEASANGIAVASRMVSDQVGDQLISPLIAIPFGIPGTNANGTGVGNIGWVSSLDHPSNPNSNVFKGTSEGTGNNATSSFNMYPIINPATLNLNGQTNISGEATALFNAGLLFDSNWNGFQPRPTIHKPRVGGSTTTASIPDVPADFNGTAQQYGIGSGTNNTAFATRSPEIGIAIPMGTPAGTYTGTILPFEDETPVQWREWLRTSNATYRASLAANPDADDDGLYNVLSVTDGVPKAPIEPSATPAIIAKVTVQEARLTEGVTRGSLAQIDPVFIPFTDKLGNPAVSQYGKPSPVSPYAEGFNALPAALITPPDNNATSRLFLYWTTNRNNQTKTAPSPTDPVDLTWTTLTMPYQQFTFTDYAANTYPIFRGDAQFSVPGDNGKPDARWWATDPATGGPFSFQNIAGLGTLFPSAATGAGDPFIPGLPITSTARFASPAAAPAYHIRADGSYIPDTEAYLTWMGQVDKQQTVSNAGAGTSANQVTESRVFLAPLNGGVPTLANAGSYLNDPNIPKLGPKPLLLKIEADNTRGLPQQKMLYLFWSSGAQGHTNLYYNANVYHAAGGTLALNQLADTMGAEGFQVDANNTSDPRLGDQKLPMPDALSWQGDPYPVYKRIVARNPFVLDKDVNNPNYYHLFDCIDVYYTGVLKNRKSVEILMTRYGIYRGENLGQPAGANLKIGQLIVLPLPTVVQETLAPMGSGAYSTRDAAFYTNSTTDLTKETPQVDVMLVRNGNTYELTLDPNTGKALEGRFDPASGLLFYDLAATDPATGKPATDNTGAFILGGGRMIVDPRAGIVKFPNVAPQKGDTLLISYVPQVMRMNTDRSDSNITTIDSRGNLIANPYGNFNQSNFQAPPRSDSAGANSTPIVIMDRGPNLRQALLAPQVCFSQNGAALAPSAPTIPVDRLWLLYRKTNVSGSAGGTIYYKAMRLMAKLPFPPALTVPNGNTRQQQILRLVVSNNIGPYEVDYARGRVYFTEADEGNTIRISYNYALPNNNNFPQSGNLTYRVSWSDEISAASSTGDETTPETSLPTTKAVTNDSQVTAVKDPLTDKLWVFWSSTGSGSLDLYSIVLAPRFYPSTSNQQ